MLVLPSIKVTFGRPVDPQELQRLGKDDQPHDRIVATLDSQVVAFGGDRREHGTIEVI